MINIFNISNKSKSRNKQPKKKTKSHKDLSKIGEEKLSKVNPMAFGILAIKAQESPDNEFLKSSLKVMSESPHFLTDKWIASINNFVDSVSKAILLDPPSHSEGDRVNISNIVVTKIVAPKDSAEYPMPALLCVDDRGWKFYFKTSKAYDYPAGSVISLIATVSSHKEGITFLRRPSRIEKVEKVSSDTTEERAGEVIQDDK